MENTIFKTVDEIRAFINADISNNFDTIAPYLYEAKRIPRTSSIYDILGKAQWEALINWYADCQLPTEDCPLSKLLHFVRIPLANFAYMIALQKGIVSFGESGLVEISSQNFEPASINKIDIAKKAFASSAYNALEDLIEFLEENVADYPLWQQSEAYSYQRKFFINNAKEFNHTVFSNISRRDYLDMRQYIFQAEQSFIKPVTCLPLYKKLKAAIRTGTAATSGSTGSIGSGSSSGSGTPSPSAALPAEYNALLTEYIYPAVCYMATWLHKPTNENAKTEGTRYIQQLRNHLNEYAAAFLEFQESDCYEDTVTPNRHQNTDESAVFVSG